MSKPTKRSESVPALPSRMDWSGRTVLITGGTGSFGKKFAEIMLKHYRPHKLIVFSRDELKQHEMKMAGYDHPSLRYFIGDVRDAERLRRAMRGVDTVVHAAALKQVPACEYNPIEAIQTNIIGGKNIIEAALDCGVERVVALSTDKAVNPVNLYGATKLCAEKLFIQSNAYSGASGTKLSCVRYGNVVGSRGSVLPLFLAQRRTGKITVTDERMTRFWITLEQGVRFAIEGVEMMSGGEVFVPKIPSMRVTDLARAIAPECSIEYIGIRPGEKLHEVLISEDESSGAYEFADRFVISPAHMGFSQSPMLGAKRPPESFRYASNTNDQWLTEQELKQIAQIGSETSPRPDISPVHAS